MDHNTETNPRRIAGLDLMKVLGLYFVVLYHLTFRSPPDVFTGGVGDILIYGLSTFMSICVPLFFTTSGALALRRPMNLRKNTLRCVHLGLLILFWTTASLLIVLALRGEQMSPWEFLAAAEELRVGYIQHLWYLPTFLFLTLLLPVLHGLWSGSKKFFRYGFFLLLIFTFGNLFLNDLEYLLRWILGSTGQTGTRLFFWFINFFVYHYWYAVCYLGLGALLMEYRETLLNHWKAALAVIPVCMGFLTLFALARCHVRGEIFDPIFNNYGDIFTMIMTIAVSILLLKLQPCDLIRRCAASISTCSLGIYLVHWLIIEALMNFLPSVTDAVAFAPLTAVAVMGLSWGISWVFLKIPLVGNLFTASPAWIHGRKKA